MSETKELTFKELADHKSKKDLYVVIHDKVYDASSFVDEHPGGEEVLLDVGGQDATEAFEDVGHSDEAREILDKMKIGKLKRMPGDPDPSATYSHTVNHAASTSATTSGAGMGVGLYAVVLVGAALALGAWKYLQAQQEGK